MILKECRDCGALKPLGEFPPAKKMRDGRGTYCKACMTVRSRASYRKRVGLQGRQVRQPAMLAAGCAAALTAPS